MNDKSSYQRSIARALKNRLAEAPQRLQILAGPRQVGKTTLIGQVLSDRPMASYYAAAADAPTRVAELTWAALSTDAGGDATPTQDWLEANWRLAERRAEIWDRSEHSAARELPFVLVLDEVQLVPQWSSVVKGLWDAARTRGLRMQVVLLGSAPLLVQQGLTESLAGRYELLRMCHWSFEEMNDAFGLTLDQYIFFGGYPGSAALIKDESRWRAYVRDALIEPNIQKDVLAMSRVDKPAMLRQLFELGCAYSGQVVSLDKVRGQLGGHTDTFAHHLVLLAQAGMLGGLQKYAAQQVRQRASPPKFQTHNNALMTVMANYGYEQALADRSHWGRLVESAVGAHLVNTADADTRVHYWRERDMEVDFVVERRGKLAAIEVKTGADSGYHRGLSEFCRRYPDARRWLVGGEDLPLGEFLRQNADHWTR
jgi:uncharacterized protein